jgi:hypothetical protein
MSQRACTENDYLKVMTMTGQGASLAEIMAATGVSKRTIARMRNGQWSPPAGPSMPLLGRSPLTGTPPGPGKRTPRTEARPVIAGITRALADLQADTRNQS